MFKAHFDVSRNSEISLQTYLRSGEGPESHPAGKDGQGDDVMGVGDIFLGGIKFVPDFETMRTSNEWYTLSGGSGQVHVEVSYRTQQVRAGRERERRQRRELTIASRSSRRPRSTWRHLSCSRSLGRAALER